MADGVGSLRGWECFNWLQDVHVFFHDHILLDILYIRVPKKVDTL